MSNNEIKEKWDRIFDEIRSLNPNISERRKDARKTHVERNYRLQKVLVANRGEIAKRFFFALHEEGIPSVAIVTDPDVGQSWYDFAGEVVHIGDSMNYTSMDVVIGAAIMTGANAIYPGYGFLSEKADFVRALNEASKLFNREIIFMGPDAEVMDRVGDKVKARLLAKAHGVPLLDGDDDIQSLQQALESANRIGYPVMVKLSAGGGGRGIVPCFNDTELAAAVEDCQRLGKQLYNDDTYFIEKFVQKPVHMEVQIFNGHAIGIRKCAVQRRNQKIIEESGHTLVDDSTALSMLAQAQTIARISGYSEGCGAGTVEYLFDASTGHFGFLEMNTRLQVEYAVTEQSLGIDLVKWQIAQFDGRESEIPFDETLRNRLRTPAHAIECRVYAEEPADDYRPSPGLITEVLLPTFNGIRCDFGFGGQDRVASMYDAMIGKIIAYGSTRGECIIRLERALQELYVKGLHTNVKQLLAIVRHPEFIGGKYTNKMLDEFPELTARPGTDGEKHKSERRGRSAIALGTLTEYVRLVREASENFIRERSFGVSIEKRNAMRLPFRFNVGYNSAKYVVDIYPVSLEKYYIMIDGEYNGKVYLSSSNIAKGDYIFRFGSSSYRLRVDRRTKYISVRIKDSDNKHNYYRLEVFPEGSTGSKDPVGMVRSPFQSTFVSLSKDSSDQSRTISTGSLVKKGDTLLIISSMKMETKIVAPVDGRIEYMIEDGNLERLILGKTSDGRILGKSIQEDDVLVMIKPAKAEEAENGEDSSADRKQAKQYRTKWFVHESDIEKFIIENPRKFMPVVLELLHAGIGGLIHRPGFLVDLLNVLEKADENKWRDVLTPETEKQLCSLVTFYYDVLKLFSPVVRGGLSFHEELNYYIRNLDNYEYKPGHLFKELILSVLENYGIKELKPSIEGEMNIKPVAFFNIQVSYYICYENKDVIKKLIRILSYSSNTLPSTAETLVSLMNYEQSEPDDSLAVFARKVLSEKFPEVIKRMAGEIESLSENSAVDFIQRAFPPESMAVMAEFESSLKASASAEKGNSVKVENRELAAKLEVLAQKYRLAPLYSPFDDIILYSAANGEGSEPNFVAFVTMKKIAEKPGDEADYSIINHQRIEEALEKAYKVLSVYNLLEKRNNNRIEIIATDQVLEKDPVSNGIGQLNFLGLKGLSPIAGKYLAISGAESILFFFTVSCRKEGLLSKVYELRRKDSGFALDLLAERDLRNPYNATSDQREANLYRMGKWPMDIWARETFDNGEYEELTIDTIDHNAPGVKEGTRVAASIHIGKINGSTACFYMKDSRINGGATGDLEGLKYLAAVYISYLKGWPLYVWNDGAGANIGEGMVSLNRGAEGFMLNTMSGHMGREDFLKYARGSSDPRLVQLFATIDRQIFSEGFPEDRSYHFITCVGVGSSAGLDVYGSSQAPVQIILDSDQSYRVLTGSAVIKSVMGENITNYDIGGARVMSKWAGIVDLVAADKFRLVSQIRRVHSLFASEEPAPDIRRSRVTGNENEESTHFSESMVISNVDDKNYLPFKQDYYGSGSVVAGFAKMGGRRVAILGPRSADGLRSYASIVRAHDVLRTASRMKISSILILGKRWHQDAELYDGPGVRARMDFVNVLKDHGGLRITVVTDISGFHCLEITSHSDVIVFVRNRDLDAVERDFVERNATFMVSSLDDAFDLGHQLINYVDPLPGKQEEAQGYPDIPTDAGSPYDMIESLIRKISDGGRFLEFFAEMNTVKTRSNFITGLTRINGDTVAILADQPLILGGGADAPGAEKYRVFVSFANRFKIKILMLSNSSGFIPGTKQERIRIQAIGGEAIDTNILGRQPVVSVVVNQNYGGRQIQAFNKFLRPGIYYLARENSTMAVIGHSVAFDLLKAKGYRELLKEGKNDEAEAYKKNFIDGYLEKARARNDATKTGAVDELITDIRDMRSMIIQAFSKAAERCRSAFD